MDSFGEDIACLQSQKPLSPLPPLTLFIPWAMQHHWTHPCCRSIEARPAVGIWVNPSSPAWSCSCGDKTHHSWLWSKTSSHWFRKTLHWNVTKVLDLEETRSCTEASAQLRFMSKVESKTSHPKDGWLACYSPQITQTSFLFDRNRLFWTIQCQDWPYNVDIWTSSITWTWTQNRQQTTSAQIVTEEVLRTVLTEIEGILNSKPLGYVSSDIADVDPVTPYLLIMGRYDASLPLVSYHDTDLLSRQRWHHTQILSDHFWKHFTKSYLPILQTRHKWQRENPDLQLNSVVMIVTPNYQEPFGL